MSDSTETEDRHSYKSTSKTNVENAMLGERSVRCASECITLAAAPDVNGEIQF